MSHPLTRRTVGSVSLRKHCECRLRFIHCIPHQPILIHTLSPMSSPSLDSTNPVIKCWFEYRICDLDSGTFFRQACETLGIEIGDPDSYSSTIGLLMPGGGPDASEFPADSLRSVCAAISWAASLVHYPPAWLSLHPSQAAFLLAICGIKPNFYSHTFWSEQILPLRDRFRASGRLTSKIFMLRPGDSLTVRNGDTLRVAPHPELSGPDPLFFQIQCDELGIRLPYDFEDTLSNVSDIYTSHAIETSWPEWISPRELVAIHLWVEYASQPPAAPAWQNITEEHCTNILRALGFGSWRNTTASLPDRIELVIQYSRAHHGPSQRQFRQPLQGSQGCLLHQGQADEIASVLPWLQSGLHHIEDPADPFRSAILQDQITTLPEDAAVIRALVDLLPTRGVRPDQVPPTLQTAAAQALTWAMTYAFQGDKWSTLSMHHANFLVASCGYRPSSCPEQRQTALQATRTLYSNALSRWIQAGNQTPPYPRMDPARDTTYDISLWIHTGALPIRGALWFAESNSHAPVDNSDDVLESLRFMRSPAYVPAGFIPPHLEARADLAIKWAILNIESHRVMTLARDQRAFLMGVCGLHPSPGDRDFRNRVRKLELRLLQALRLKSAAVNSAGPSSDITELGHMGSSRHCFPLVPFFEPLLRMAGLRRPTDKLAIEEILAYTPPLPFTGVDDSCRDLERQERVSSLVWCYVTPRDSAGDTDSLWSKPPRAALIALWNWLSDEPLHDHVTNQELGRLCALAADKLFSRNRSLRSTLAACCHRPPATLIFLAPPSPAESPRECTELFTLLCTASSIQLPGSAEECRTILASMHAKTSGLATAPSDTRYREAMAAVLWATNLVDNEQAPPLHTLYPTAPVLETLSTMFPVSCLPGQNAWTHLISTIQRRWNARDSHGRPKLCKRPPSDGPLSLAGVARSSDLKRPRTPPDEDSPGHAGSAKPAFSSLLPRSLQDAATEAPDNMQTEEEHGSGKAATTQNEIRKLKDALTAAHNTISVLRQEKERDAHEFAHSMASSSQTGDTLRNNFQDALGLVRTRESEVQSLQRQLKAAETQKSLMELCINHNIAAATAAQQKLVTSQQETATAQAQAILLGARLLALEAAAPHSAPLQDLDQSQCNDPTLLPNSQRPRDQHLNEQEHRPLKGPHTGGQ